LLMHEDEKVTITLQKVRELTAPVREWQTGGYLSYEVVSQEWKRVRLVAAGEIKAVDLNWCICRVVEKWMISE
ncbi:MAG: D-alanyl-D-alanine carboxypeptidase, partial [Lachnospiraceae bacterium]|nr:D-alanyl-D-alanine carboxypeptidase [Lachnospiraceae bacterium]